ncbi:concanavalin A-like lectin/glucanase superfamily protein [Nitrospirillum amazonense]|uniref:Concanavalin A-like lectin/glucanase superfamily protein n=1 Tax=Nitrospirillum amazonense TaxID=28077 RepID=A0A560KHB7_9PROT|nr:LamG domain-containing protein [Nitrospirillum amazonense]TWB82592.1 concanavalin A-like lectin/glucanase superfamily protein [Nitrospirillum amazonense]
MTDLATQVAGLTTSVNALTSAVNVAKATLDASVSAAGASATTAQAAVTTAASSATAAQAAQAAAVAVSGLSNLNSFLGQIQAGAPTAVFWYDTTRDSDGGAWRKRCTWQSWVTEAASSTRGSRASFPGQALIVVVGSTMTIYDADQATPIMWMVFNLGIYLHGYGAVTSVTARDGCLYRSDNTGTDGDVYTLDFIRDDSWGVHSAYKFRPSNPRIVDRNSAATSAAQIGPAIGASQCNSVAVTVVPGAPIDRTTGLPKPTIVIAHINGISVIHPSGQVANITAGGGYLACAIIDGLRLAAILAANSTIVDYGPIPYANIARSAWLQYSAGTPSGGGAIQRPETTGIGGVIDGGLRNLGALWRYHEDPVNPAAGMLAMITASGGPYAGGGAFNTGWMVGDCRLALSSTSTASVVASGELVTNGTFASTSGWIAYQGATLAAANNTLTITNGAASNGIAYQVIATVAGQTYLVTVDGVGGTSTVAIVSAGSAVNSNDLGQVVATSSATGITLQFTAKTTTSYVNLVCDNVSGHTVSFKNCSVQLAEPDRSAKAIGLRVVGTLTKALVATAADLSAIGGFSTSNYLLQPYNPALDFGTGDFSVAFWAKNVSNTGSFLRRESNTGSGSPLIRAIVSGGKMVFVVGDGTNTASVTSVSDAWGASMPWTLYTLVRRAGTLELRVNSVLEAANASTVGSVTNTAATLVVGNAIDGSYPGIGMSMALIRISATAPTPEQIARMYADERPLFQPGAKCVLGGTSAAVQGLAHDPDTGALYAAKSDGTSVFQGLVRTAHLTGLATTSNSDNHSAVAARQGGYVIATANQAVASQPAITFRDRILADRVPVAPIDANRVVFPVVATTDATPTVIARLPVAEGDELQLFVDVEATEYGATPTERMGYQRRARVYRLPNGNVTVAAVQTLATDYESATTTCDVTVVAETASQTVCVQATGVAGKRLAWATLVHINRSGATRYAA